MTDVRTPLRSLVSNFRAGELDPRLYMRADADAYPSGARSLKNCMIRNTGAAERRPGTTLKRKINQRSRLFGFEFDDNEKYVLAFGVNALSIFDTVTGDLVQQLSGATDCPWDATTVWEMTYAQSANTAFIAHRNFRTKVLTRTGLTSFSMANFNFDESADGAVVKQPYYKFANENSTISVSGSSGSVTVTASEAVFTSADVGSMIRRYGQELEITAYTSPTVVTASVRPASLKVELDPNPFRVTNGSTTVEITHIAHGLSSGASVTIAGANAVGGLTAANINGTRTITVIDENRYTVVAGAAGTSSEDGGGSSVTIVTTAATSNWDEQLFSTSTGWPGAVTFHEDRLWFGGHPEIPDGIWSSVTGRYFNFDIGEGQADRSIQLAIGSSRIPNIRHLVSNKTLQIFAEGSEYIIRENDNGLGLTPSNVSIESQTPYGCSFVAPLVFDGATIFVQAAGSTAREFIYDYTSNSYQSPDLTTLSSHLFHSPRDFAVLYGSDTRPEQYAFFVNENGTLAVFHSIRSEGLAAWVPWETRSGDTFDSVCALSGEVYFSVLRNGVYYLEQLMLDSDVTLDCAVEMSAAATDTWHLDADFPDNPWCNETVQVRSGDFYLGSYMTDMDCILTLDDEVTSIQAGFSYGFEIIPMAPDQALADGPMTGEKRRITACTVHLYDTLSLSVNGKKAVTRLQGFVAGDPPTRLTGKKRFFVRGWSRDPLVTISQDAPMPATVLGLIMEVSI